MDILKDNEFILYGLFAILSSIGWVFSFFEKNRSAKRNDVKELENQIREQRKDSTATWEGLQSTRLCVDNLETKVSNIEKENELLTKKIIVLTVEKENFTHIIWELKETNIKQTTENNELKLKLAKMTTKLNNIHAIVRDIKVQISSDHPAIVLLDSVFIDEN